MPSAVLDDRGLVRIAGVDARAFLQGLVTCDMSKVAPRRAAFGALLSPQGKIICDFIVMEAEGAFLLDCPGALAADLVKRLRIYKLRAKVEIADVSADYRVVARWGDDATGIVDPRDAALGARETVPRAAMGPGLGDVAAYEACRIASGVPGGGLDFAYGDAYPHETNMDLLGGVDFDKGCYVGQEVVSRMEHRGSARTRIARVDYTGEAPKIGETLAAGDLKIGRMGSAAGGHGLAMIRVDRFLDATRAGTPVLAGDRAVTIWLAPGL